MFFCVFLFFSFGFQFLNYVFGFVGFESTLSKLQTYEYVFIIICINSRV